jgi:mycothiol synthase
MAKQLLMNWPAERLGDSLKLDLPEGYLLRNFQSGDTEAYINLMKSAGFNEWNNETFNSVIEKAIPNGLFFIEHIESSEIVGTTVGSNNPTKYFPNGGELGWVAVNPSHCGKGLGCIVCAAVTKRFLELGYREIYLLTDDFRLPAIKIYLNLGYVPFYYLPDMKKRWENIFKKFQ